VNILIELVKLTLLVTLANINDAVSLERDLASTQPMSSLIVPPLISISPVEEDSMEYSSVIALPAPIMDQPLVVLNARSLTCGE